MTTAWITRPEGGGGVALHLMLALALWCGRMPARVALYPITAYFVLRRGPERAASRAYLARALGRKPRLADVFRHFHTFARVTLDRVFLLCNKFDRFTVTTHGIGELHRAMDLGRGVLLFGAHFGSFEALRVASLERPDVPVLAVIDLGQNPTVSKLLTALSGQLAGSVINARQPGIQVALEIKDALQRGDLVTLLADRIRPGGRCATAHFLGDTAGFPAAPWELAAAVNVPIVLCFGVYSGGNDYDLYFELLTERVSHDRQSRDAGISVWVQKYADRLSAHAQMAPYNWFNFYDIWCGEVDAEGRPEGAAHGGTVARRCDHGG